MSLKHPVSVCMIARHLPPEYTGAGQQALSLARRLNDKINIFAVCEQGRQKPGKKNVGGVAIHRLKTYGNRPCGNRYEFGIGKIIFAITLLFFLIKNNKRYDIIHCIGSSFIVIPAVIAAKLFKKRVCVKITLAGPTGDDPDSLKHSKIGRIVYRSLLKTGAIICVSRQLYDICRKNNIPSEKLYKIPNGADTSIFRPLSQKEKNGMRSRLGLPKDALIICFSGRIARRKRLDLVIKGISKALESNPNLFLLVIGPKNDQDKVYMVYLDNLIRTHNIVNRIHFTGLQKIESAKNYMQASDIFILPSDNEGLPNALIEAMACGLCCIVADTPPLNQLIEHKKDGWLVNFEKTDEMIFLLNIIARNKSEMDAVCAKARRKAIELYDIAKTTEKYIFLYSKLLA